MLAWCAVVTVVVGDEASDDDDPSSVTIVLLWLPRPGYKWVKSLRRKSTAAMTINADKKRGTPMRMSLRIFSSLERGLPSPTVCTQKMMMMMMMSQSERVTLGDLCNCAWQNYNRKPHNGHVCVGCR